MADTLVKHPFFIIINIGFVLNAFCPTASLRHHIAPCEVVRPCVCEFPSGEGIDLSILSNQTFSANINGSTNIVLFQPCQSISAQNFSTCNETSLCFFNSTSNSSTPLGNVDELTFNSENLVKPVELQFSHSQIISTIELSCPESDNLTSFTGNRAKDNEYHFVLKSPAACIKSLQDHHGRSLVSVFFISALIVLITYFVAMMIVRHSRGAVGWELLPHHDTLMRIPGLCKAGCTRMLSCCKLQPSYEQI